MPDILHRIGVKSSSPAVVYRALATTEGLAAWWTHDTRGDSRPGGVIRFRFGPPGGFDMKVLDLQEGRRVLWEVVDGPAEWIGTRVSFDLEEDGDFTILLFRHEGWKEAGVFMHHCSTKWATFLMSLKALLETGTGAPHPHDIKIDNWN